VVAAPDAAHGVGDEVRESIIGGLDCQKSWPYFPSEAGPYRIRSRPWLALDCRVTMSRGSTAQERLALDRAPQRTFPCSALSPLP
jgi:hypothetical protein